MTNIYVLTLDVSQDSEEVGRGLDDVVERFWHVVGCYVGEEELTRLVTS